MKKLLSIFLSLVLSISVLGVCNISFAAQTADIEPTKLINSSAYYSFDANTKTLTISGKGESLILQTQAEIQHLSRGFIGEVTAQLSILL